MSKIRTIYNPGVGIVYFIKNVKTSEEIEASTLTTRDADQKPWRSPRGTLEGQEFFKMKSGSKKIGFTYYTFMNSIKNEQCISSDGEWIFTARKPNGNTIQKLVEIIKKEKAKSVESDSGSNQIRYKVDKINTESIAMSDDKIKEKINSITSDDFSANDQLLELMGKGLSIMSEGVTYKVLIGDNRETLSSLEDNSIQTVITSPPYFALKRYGDSDKEIGIEETPEAYISNLCDVFDIIKLKLKDTGTMWVNLGDTYSSNVSEGIKKFGSKNFQAERPGRQNVKQPKRKITGDLKPKDLIGIPWMFAFEMRKRGWFLRQDIIWSKSNPLPESVEDRCTKSHEYIFLFSKNEDYYFDYNAISEKSDTPLKEKKKEEKKLKNFSFDDLENEIITENPTEVKENNEVVWEPDGTRRKRSVWNVPVSCGEAIGIQHYATYPKKLIEPCIFSGSQVGDIILDPFNGSGTTGVVALENGRNYIGCELNQDFEKIYTARLNEALAGYNLSQGIIDKV